MGEKITYTYCPNCKSENISKALLAKDFTVSKELFEIWHCNYCALRFTQNIPAPQDIGKYYQSQDYISHSDTKKGFINNLYHRVRNITLRSKRKLVEDCTNQKSGNLLDIGAGTGAFAATMQQSGWHVTGLEPDKTARQNALNNYALVLQSSETLYTLADKSFDAITMWHVLEHVHELHKYFDTFQNILKQDGVLFIAVPNYTSYDAYHYKEYWAAYDVPRHLYHFSPQSMSELAQYHKFSISSMEPMWFDSFYVSMLSEKNHSGKSHVLKALYLGFLSNMYTLSKASRCSSLIYILRKKN